MKLAKRAVSTKGGMLVAIKLNSTAAQSSLTKVFPRVSSNWPERPEITRPLPPFLCAFYQRAEMGLERASSCCRGKLETGSSVKRTRRCVRQMISDRWSLWQRDGRSVARRIWRTVMGMVACLQLSTEYVHVEPPILRLKDGINKGAVAALYARCSPLIPEAAP
jgi:hypothetical protein